MGVAFCECDPAPSRNASRSENLEAWTDPECRTPRKSQLKARPRALWEGKRHFMRKRLSKSCRR